METQQKIVCEKEKNNERKKFFRQHDEVLESYILHI